MMIRKGDIYVCSFYGKLIHLFVCSSQLVNENSSRIIVAPMSYDLSEIYSFEYIVSGNVRSKIMFDHIRSISKDRLLEKLGSVTPKDITQINMILKYFLAI